MDSFHSVDHRIRFVTIVVHVTRSHSDIRRTGCRLPGLILLSFFLYGASTGMAQPKPPRITGVRVGFEGHFKVGEWSPIEVSVSGPRGSAVMLVVRGADPDGSPVLFPFPEIILDEDVTQVFGVFLSGRLEAPVQIQLRQGEQIVDSLFLRAGSEALRPLRQSSQLWMIVGEQPAFEIAAQRWKESLPGDLSTIVREDLSDRFPEQGLDSLDLIVLSPSTFVSLQASASLRRWVERGGRLVVPVGAGVAALAASPLSEWLPIRPTGQTDIRNLGGINSAVPGSTPLRMLGSLPAAQLDPAQGRVLASGLTGPLILRTAYGIGQVTVLGFPLDQRPLANWSPTSQSDLAALLADVIPPWRAEFSSRPTADAMTDLDPTGVSDLQTQLVHALDHFDDVPRTSHWVVMGWIALFVVLIGPVDYFLLHHFLKRPHWTWVTLPVWIGLVSLFAIAQANGTNEQPLQGRQLDIADVDASSGVLRVRSWMNYYSPETQRSRVVALPSDAFRDGGTETLSTRMLRSGWVSRPESGFRGMYRPGGIDASKPEYTISEDRQFIENLPTQIWSTGSMATEWEMDIVTQDLIEFDLTDTGAGRVRGTLTHHLPGPLSDWFLAYGSFAYFPPSGIGAGQQPLLPGETWDVGQARSNILRGVLVGLTQSSIAREAGTGQDPRISRDVFDPLARDPFMLARIISFHGAAGGTGYTGLLNQSLKKLDLSTLLPLDRAVLFGRLELPATRFGIDVAEVSVRNQETFVRIIIPVERILRTGDTPPDPSLLERK